MWRTWLERLALLVLAVTYWFYGWLWRVSGRRPVPRVDSAAHRIYAHWHTDELVLIHVYSGEGIGVLASKSRDGERLSFLLGLLGYRSARGSSSRGGVGGLKGIIDFVRRSGVDASMAVDGPRGPIFRVKPGVLKLAQATGAEIVPLAVSAAKRFVFKRAWNRCYLPLPFSRCRILYGEPFTVPAEIDDEEFERTRKRLESVMMALKVEAETGFSWEPHPSLVENQIPVGA